MDTDLRASLVAAAAAAVLSVLVGVVAGVGLLAIILRAVLGGALFGVLVYGCIYLARRSLPGFSFAGGERLEAEVPGEEPDERGHAVDIVLPGEGPAGAGVEEAPIEELASVDARRDDARLETLPLATSEPLSSSSPRTAAGRSPMSAPETGSAPEDVASLLGPDGHAESPVAVPTPEAPGLSSFDDLDVLPDLDGFSDSFAPAEFHGAAEDSSSAPRAPSSRGASGPAGSLRTESLDPASLAQAVRTILKRDQKG